LRIVGPLPGTAGELPELLHVAHFLWRAPASNILDFYRRTRPAVVARAKALPKPDSGSTLDEAFSTFRG
jgi:hypothetical protein